MPSDNPFAEPNDSDRTVFIPAPGGRRTAPALQAAPPPPPMPQAAAPSDGPDRILIGSNPLLAAASSLLALLARLRNTARAPDAGDLRERAVAELRHFEQQARDGGVAMEQLRPAHYALCASLDDVVLATPWGNESSWATRSLVSTFHQQVRSGEGFFAVLKQLIQAPGANLSVLELMYFCLSLGFQGQYRLSPRGPAELDRVREDLYALILRQRGARETGLSPHWQGVDAPYKPRRGEVPLWVAGAAGLAVLGAIFLWMTLGLNTASDNVMESLLAAPPTAMPQIARQSPVTPPPPPAEPGALDRLRAFLAPEIAAHLVSVVGTEAVPVVRISGTGMFASGSATLEPRFLGLLGRIGEALKTEPGHVTVAGYTDNQPIRTVRFPSNFQLSAARAAAASSVIGQSIDNAGRLTAEGRADADPLAPNNTLAGREMNRRIEVILHRQG
jgi:type VI secretion system protein ImpK